MFGPWEILYFTRILDYPEKRIKESRGVACIWHLIVDWMCINDPERSAQRLARQSLTAETVEIADEEK
jgi:hypothetical protein